MKREYYQKKSENFKEELIVTNKKSQMISLIRFIVFVTFAICLMIALYDRELIFLIPAFIFFVGFICLVIIHARVEWQIKKLTSSLEISNNYLKRFDYQWQEFTNKGEQFIENASFICRDLDIIGKNSLFQYLNLANSNKGQEKLFNSLNANEISNNSEAIHELATKQDLHLELASLINMYDYDKADLILNDENRLNKLTRKIYYFIAYIYPILILLNLLLVIINVLPIIYLVIMLVINALIILARFSANKDYLSSIHKNHGNLDVVLRVIKKLEENEYETEKLKDIKDVLTSEFIASKSINSLVRLKERLESQSNVLMYLLAQIFLMWDYRNVVYFDTWKDKSGKNAQKYLDIFYDIEMMLSLGVIEQTKEQVTSANVKVDNYPHYKAIGLYHPLLNNENVIANDFNCLDQTTIITGSNMSGKTTFIRSIGINLVLAYSGAYVCAQEFNVSLMKVFTSIRVEDNLNDGISTFYAEINRIKEMIEYEKNGQPMLCLIDEIFKGTNSEDRIYGAQKAITQLTKPYCITLITTHDAKLCELENISNYHFEEYYDNDKIKFDYQIHSGTSKTRNAKYLLKMAGIID